MNNAIKKNFEVWLINNGYKQYTPTGLPSTVYDYIKRVDKVVVDEQLGTWDELIEHIDYYVGLYDINGDKANEGQKSHRAVINALKACSRFVYSRR